MIKKPSSSICPRGNKNTREERATFSSDFFVKEGEAYGQQTTKHFIDRSMATEKQGLEAHPGLLNKENRDTKGKNLD